MNKEPYYNLANSIILTAVNDYLRGVLYEHGDKYTCEPESKILWWANDARAFFYTQYFMNLYPGVAPSGDEFVTLLLHDSLPRTAADRYCIFLNMLGKKKSAIGEEYIKVYDKLFKSKWWKETTGLTFKQQMEIVDAARRNNYLNKRRK